MRKKLPRRTGLQISELAFGGGVTGGILIDADEATRLPRSRARSRLASTGCGEWFCGGLPRQVACTIVHEI
jgi:hypothetical protein